MLVPLIKLSIPYKIKYKPTATRLPHLEMAAEDSSRSPRIRSQMTSPLDRSRACSLCEWEPMNTVVLLGPTSSTGEASTHLPVSELQRIRRPSGRTSERSSPEPSPGLLLTGKIFLIAGFSWDILWSSCEGLDIKLSSEVFVTVSLLSFVPSASEKFFSCIFW